MKHTLKDILVLIATIITLFLCFSIAIQIALFTIKLIISTISLLFSLAVLASITILIIFIIMFIRTYFDESKKRKTTIKL